MQKAKMCFCVILSLLATGVFADEALVRRAVEKLAAGNVDEFRYTRITLKKEQGQTVKTVEKYDPSLPEKWVLVLVDENKPTDEEIKKYRKEKAKEEKARSKNSDGSFTLSAENFYKEGSLELISRDENRLSYRFEPAPPEEGKGLNFTKGLYGIMDINIQGGYIEKLSYHPNSEEYSPVFGVTIEDFAFEMTFRPAWEGGPVLISQMKSLFKGTAFLVKKFDEDSVIIFQEYAVL